MKRHTDGIGMHTPRNRGAWRIWLEKHHESERSVWLVYKKGQGGKRNITYVEAVEEALCFGWIDSKPVKLDESTTLQYFSQRRPKSGWSSLNKSRVSKLMKQKMMHPAGIHVVKLARRNGTWKALDNAEKLIVPDDLAVALKELPEAHLNFEAFPKSAKKIILGWIYSAKKPETREKRILETVQQAAKNVRANQYVKKDGAV